MTRFVRATGLSVAALSVAAGIAFAGPSQAGQSSRAPVTTSYIDHAAAGTFVAEAAINTNEIPTRPSSEVEDSTVVQHAVATTDLTEAADVEDTAKPKSLGQLVNEHLASEVPDSEAECLAGAVYFESKGEPLSGQLAVAEVIINRAKSGRFPASLCGVVKQRGQFSFVRGGQLPAVPRASAHWKTAVAIAKIAMRDLADGAAPRALFFHARRVTPGWKLTRIAAVGNHVFYR